MSTVLNSATTPNNRIKTRCARVDIYLWAGASRKFSPQAAALYAGRYVAPAIEGTVDG